MNYAFFCNSCKCTELKLKFVRVTEKNTFMHLICLECKQEAEVSITDIEAKAIGGTKPPKKPNGGA